jgi:CRISPR-associated protein Cmr3
MKYLVTLSPLEPFLFGGDNTFGKLGDEINGTYLVKSRQFPQQSAILGMLKKEIMTQNNLLTRQLKGEWVEPKNKQKAENLVGFEKFDIFSKSIQNFGKIKNISPMFFIKNDEIFIKKVDIDSFDFEDGVLKGYKTKIDIYDNFINIATNEKLTSDKIFKPIEKTANKKGGEENSLFKKTSYLLNDNFKFAFYLDCDCDLKNSIITLGADRSSFKMEVKEDNSTLNYEDKKAYLTLISDAYITLSLKDNCDFAISSEISYQNLQNQKHAFKHNEFKKSDKVYLYEKGSVIINPSQALIDDLNNKNLQQIGYNIFTKGKN